MLRFSDALIRNLAPEPKQRIVYDDSVAGFGLRISPHGTKAFILTLGRDRERLTIGRYPIIGLAEARNEAKRILAERTLGAKRPSRLLASEALTHFIGEQKQKNRPITVDYTHKLLINHFPGVWRKPLEEVRTEDITNVTDRLLRRDQPGAANHAFTAIKTFLRWCVKRRYIQHSPIEALDRPSRVAARERVLNDEELRIVYKAAGSCGTFGEIVKLLILTGQRRSEIGSLRQEWCSLKSGSETQKGSLLSAPYKGQNDDDSRPSISRPQSATICIPSEYTKNKKSHQFPVGDLTTSLLLRLQTNASSTFYFPARNLTSSPFSGWSKAKAQLDKKANINPWTLHDLRRTYATNLQRLGIRLEVIEALLNHVSGTRAGIVGVYNRHRYEAEMREAVETHDLWFTKVILSE